MTGYFSGIISRINGTIDKKASRLINISHPKIRYSGGNIPYTKNKPPYIPSFTAGPEIMDLRVDQTGSTDNIRVKKGPVNQRKPELQPPNQPFLDSSGEVRPNLYYPPLAGKNIGGKRDMEPEVIKESKEIKPEATEFIFPSYEKPGRKKPEPGHQSIEATSHSEFPIPKNTRPILHFRPLNEQFPEVNKESRSQEFLHGELSRMKKYSEGIPLVREPKDKFEVELRHIHPLRYNIQHPIPYLNPEKRLDKKLVIGKINVEIVKSPAPQVRTKERKGNPTTYIPKSPPGSSTRFNLRFGLGQIS